MNTEPLRQQAGDQVLAFLGELAPVGDLLDTLTDGEPVGVTVEVLDTGRRALLDMGDGGLQVVQGGGGLEGDIGMAATAGDLHQNFLGRLGIMEGIAARRILLRGGMCRLVKFFPVLELVPVLYSAYLDSRNGHGKPSPGPVRRGTGKVLGALVAGLGWLAGRMLRGHGRREVLIPLRAVARGAARFDPRARGPSRQRGRRNPAPAPQPNPLDQPGPGWWRRLWLGGLAAAMGATGWWVSLCRHKLGIPIDLVRVLGAVSRGLRARRGG